MEPKWLEWAKQLQAIAQTGLTYTESPYDTERYQAIREIAAQILATHSETDLSVIRNLFTGEFGYATPKVDVRGVVFRDSQILLVKEREDGRWTLPGGWADVGESPAESVVRETHEESGFQTRAVKLLAVYDRNKHPHPPMLYHVYKLFFLCELLGGSPSPSVETAAADFFDKDKLPELSLGRVTPGQIAQFFQYLRNPDLPTAFD